MYIAQLKLIAPGDLIERVGCLFIYAVNHSAVASFDLIWNLYVVGDCQISYILRSQTLVSFWTMNDILFQLKSKFIIKYILMFSITYSNLWICFFFLFVYKQGHIVDFLDYEQEQECNEMDDVCPSFVFYLIIFWDLEYTVKRLDIPIESPCIFLYKNNW